MWVLQTSLGCHVLTFKKQAWSTDCGSYPPRLLGIQTAVMGARYLMVFVWRLQDVRLIWAFVLDRRTKENVLSGLQWCESTLLEDSV